MQGMADRAAGRALRRALCSRRGMGAMGSSRASPALGTSTAADSRSRGICISPLVGKINAIFWPKLRTVWGWSQWRGCSGMG